MRLFPSWNLFPREIWKEGTTIRPRKPGQLVYSRQNPCGRIGASFSFAVFFSLFLEERVSSRFPCTRGAMVLASGFYSPQEVSTRERDE